MFETVLVANRGEIALRVVRTCREMGIRTVVAYSTADRDSAAVRSADESVHVGPAAPRRSYLSVSAMVEAALTRGAQAVHPGYGFLSEDPDFAEVCQQNGLVFIGPPPDVMARLADKSTARTEMRAAGLPLLSGSEGTVDSPGEAARLAHEIGFPVIIKAVAGGGGRGMAVVHDPRQLIRAYRATRASAQAVFGDGRVYLERFCAQARHVEVQILADAFGNVVHLGERDCSVQRRHQKLVEESPAPNLSASLREEMVDAAVAGARRLGYVGVGTVEFLVSDDRYYFMEINCRIQVEHPVTEMVTGVDLIREQIRVAAGLPLSLAQSDITHRGVSLECRVNAEDPARDFTPTAGLLTEFVPPGGPFTRVDTHAFAGWQVTSDYDSLLAKVIVWAPDRQQAIARMDRALEEFRIRGRGLHTTVPVLRRILAEPSFAAGEHRTDLLSRLTLRPPDAASAATYLREPA